MPSKISLTWTVIAASIVGVVCVATIIFFLIPDLPSHASYLSAPLSPRLQALRYSESARPGLPIRLTIPKISVDTAIEQVGLTPEGAMGVPKGPTDTAWFDLGPRPGESGNAVIAGHEGWKDGISAVFDDLHNLQKGDKLYIEDERGTTATFVVREKRTYGEHEDASDIFNASDGQAHLALITCEGIWNAALKSYSGRIVVFADKE